MSFCPFRLYRRAEAALLPLSRVAGFVLCFALAACGPLISFGDSEPDTVYTLDYTPQSTDEPEGPLLFVGEPQFSRGLGGRGIAVKLDNFERTTLKNVRWAASVGDLMREYIIMSLRDSAGVRTVGEAGLDLRSSCRLGIQVLAMEFVPGSSRTDDQITLRTEMSLISLDTGALLARRIIDEGRQTEGTPRAIVASFNTAMARTTDTLGRWLKAQVGACSEL